MADRRNGDINIGDKWMLITLCRLQFLGVCDGISIMVKARVLEISRNRA